MIKRLFALFTYSTSLKQLSGASCNNTGARNRAVLSVKPIRNKDERSESKVNYKPIPCMNVYLLERIQTGREQMNR